MKKIFIALLVLFSIITVNAEENVKLDIKWIPNAYYNYKKNNLTYWGQLGYLYLDGKLAYCLEIENPINSTTYTKTNEEQNNNLVLLAGYFGYGYNNEVNVKDYMATQKLIWSFLGTDVYFTTKSKGEGEIINVRDYEIKINSRINRYALFPKIDRNYNFEYGSSNIINDSNNIISQFKIINDSKNTIYVNGNNLIFNANEIGKNKFYLETQYVSNYKNQIYVSNNSQKIMVIGEVNNIKSAYNYNVTGGSITVKLKTSNNIDLKNNTFNLYHDNKLIGTYNTNQNGSFNIKDLEYGNYTLEVIKLIEGYKFENNKYSLVIDSTNKDIIKEIEIKPITINVNIKKSYGYEKFNIKKYDNNVTYEIYDKNNNYISSITTDNNGECNIKLEYGNYKIIQKNVSNVDIYHKDIIINTNDFNNNEKIINIYDELNDINVKIISIDNSNNEKINIKFNINNNEYNSDGILILNLKYGKYNFNNIHKEKYRHVEDFDFNLSDNSDLYVENDKLYTDLYIYLDKFEDNNDNNIPDDEEYRTIIYKDGLDEKIFNNIVFDKELDGLETPKIDEPKRENYIFTGWEPDIKEIIDGDATYTANWEEDKNNNNIIDFEEEFTIVAIANKNGSVSPENKVVKYGEDLTVLFNPNEDYTIKSLIIDNEEISINDELIKEYLTKGYVFNNIDNNHTLIVIYDSIKNNNEEKMDEIKEEKNNDKKEQIEEKDNDVIEKEFVIDKEENKIVIKNEIKKLPNLGVYDEIFKIYNIHMYMPIFNWM